MRVCVWVLWWLLLAALAVGRKDAGQAHPPGLSISGELPPVALYRLIGNDMPPLQLVGQLRWNTQYALDYERDFQGARKRWILNRIWNETEFAAIYSSLIVSGVHRRDILLRCFDLDTYANLQEDHERSLYLTSQNEGRNAGILDGRESGFEWSMILDGNTFITDDSWSKLRVVFRNASLQGLRYVKIPYHRLHEEQRSLFLNSSTKMKAILPEAPIKGESQIAFHKFAPELFTLGDTKPENSDKSKRRGYGQRNKSYMFKEGQICGHDSPICMCAQVPEGNEEQFFSKVNHTYNIANSDYTNNCGLVLRLWNFPPDNVIFTGLSPQNETGFFCFFSTIRSDIIARAPPHKYLSECHVFNLALELWSNISEPKRQPYVARSKTCKDQYHLTFLNSSCFRAEDRLVAQSVASVSIERLVSLYKVAKVKFNLSSANPDRLKEYNVQHNLCNRLRTKRKDNRRPHFLLTLSEQTLQAEQALWRSYASKVNNSVYVRPAFSSASASAFSGTNGPFYEYVSTLVGFAQRSLTLGPYAVTRKRKNPPASTDKHYYYSVQPFVWPVEEVPETVKVKLEDEMLLNGGSTLEEKVKRLWKSGYYRYEGHRLPGSEIGEVKCDNYDRSSAWYMVDNVTTLALAWYFTNDTRYAEHATKLVRSFFVNNQTSMYPKLIYAQNGAKEGIMDWKDVYYLLDSIALLGRSGALPKWVEWSMEKWCAKLADWCMHSQQGKEEAASLNHHGLYFDLTVLSLSVYAYEEDMADSARSRLMYRLSKRYPEGHFQLDGTQPYEMERPEKPAALHYATYNLVGWIHAALAVDSISKHGEIPGIVPSLWAVRHEGYTAPVIEQIGISPPAFVTNAFFQQGPTAFEAHQGDDASLPVLLKAIRWMAQYLPDQDQEAGVKAYTSAATSAAETKKVKFPYRMDEAFKFDRLLEVVQIGCQIYGTHNIFPESTAATKSKAGKLKITTPYSVNLASFSKYSSVSPESGQRSWGGVGRPRG